MNDQLLHRLFGFICASVGLVTAITGAMFWFDPPDARLPVWGLAMLMAGGSATLLAGLGVVVEIAWARYVMIAMAGLGLLASAAGVGRALFAHNLGAAIIVLTAVMPLILVAAVMIELSRGPRDANERA